MPESPLSPSTLSQNLPSPGFDEHLGNAQDQGVSPLAASGAGFLASMGQKRNKRGQAPWRSRLSDLVEEAGTTGKVSVIDSVKDKGRTSPKINTWKKGFKPPSRDTSPVSPMDTLENPSEAEATPSLSPPAAALDISADEPPALQSGGSASEPRTHSDVLPLPSTSTPLPTPTPTLSIQKPEE
eukprot:gene17227-5340_t